MGRRNMSRAYYKRHHYAKSDDQAGFPMIILLAGIFWAHQTALLRIMHIATFVALALCGVALTLALLKSLAKINKWHVACKLNAEGIDTMTGLEFERYVAKLLKTRGYNHFRLTEEYDYGVDYCHQGWCYLGYTS